MPETIFEPLRMTRPRPIEPPTSARALLTSNPVRRGATVYNSTDKPLYLDYVSTVSAEDHLIAIPPKGYWESPYSCTDALYGLSGTGAIGRVQVREFLPRT